RGLDARGRGEGAPRRPAQDGSREARRQRAAERRGRARRLPQGARVIQGVLTKPLKVIPDERGWLMEMLRDDDPFFQKFGQVYLTGVSPGVVRGWPYHRKQTAHLVGGKGM